MQTLPDVCASPAEYLPPGSVHTSAVVEPNRYRIRTSLKVYQTLETSRRSGSSTCQEHTQSDIARCLRLSRFRVPSAGAICTHRRWLTSPATEYVQPGSFRKQLRTSATIRPASTCREHTQCRHCQMSAPLPLQSTFRRGSLCTRLRWFELRPLQIRASRAVFANICRNLYSSLQNTCQQGRDRHTLAFVWFSPDMSTCQKHKACMEKLMFVPREVPTRHACEASALVIVIGPDGHRLHWVSVRLSSSIVFDCKDETISKRKTKRHLVESFGIRKRCGRK